MQIWLYFQPGAGGDGFANLLEKASNVTRHDPHYDERNNPWRIHHRVNDQIKFYFPAIDKHHCFRQHFRFDANTNQLTPGYIDCVTKNQHIICTSHDIELRFYAQNDCQEILTKNLVKVLLTCQNPQRAWLQAASKTLYTGPVDQITCQQLGPDSDQFDHVLDMDQIQRDWHYVKNFCQAVSLDLRPEDYQDYRALLAGSRQFDPAGLASYKSEVVITKTN